jgi:ABC-2 type transport system ATP-binding protein
MSSQEQPAVIIKDLYKSFRLPHEQHSGIKQALVSIFNHKRGYEVQKVLKSVSFEIEQGEFFGIVGRNGSGKSTLLKLIAGIYVPDKGLIHVNGSLTPFIELGVGFNPELTGRENVFLNGALLGFDHQQMAVMYDGIVEFAELEQFMDQKLKNYSSGMQVRLAFSIAIRAKSDILLVDEVLAVGDESFQRKCMEYFVTLKRNKQTVIFITHDMSQVRRFCDRAIYVDKGEIVASGKTSEIADLYVRNNLELEQKSSPEDQRQANVKLKAEFLSKNRIKSNEELRLKLSWEKGDKVKNAGVAIIKDTGEYVFGTNTIIDDVKVSGHEIIYDVTCNLAPGKYSLAIGLFGQTDLDIITYDPSFTEFVVEPSGDLHVWGGITKLNHTWR